jgi:hypothetical protein
MDWRGSVARRLKMAIASAIFVFALTAHAAPPTVWLRATDATGRPFDLSHLRGQVVVITVASKATLGESKEIGRRLQQIVARGEVAVVTVVNLDEVPFFAMSYARRRVAEEAARSPMFILTDEHGKLCRSMALAGSDILVIDKCGHLLHRFRGTAQLDQALRKVDELRQRLTSQDDE